MGSSHPRLRGFDATGKQDPLPIESKCGKHRPARSGGKRLQPRPATLRLLFLRGSPHSPRTLCSSTGVAMELVEKTTIETTTAWASPGPSSAEKPATCLAPAARALGPPKTSKRSISKQPLPRYVSSRHGCQRFLNHVLLLDG